MLLIYGRRGLSMRIGMRKDYLCSLHLLLFLGLFFLITIYDRSSDSDSILFLAFTFYPAPTRENVLKLA